MQTREDYLAACEQYNIKTFDGTLLPGSATLHCGSFEYEQTGRTATVKIDGVEIEYVKRVTFCMDFEAAGPAELHLVAYVDPRLIGNKRKADNP